MSLSFFLKCEREKQKIDYHIYKMRVNQEDSFAPNSFKGRHFKKKIFCRIPTKVVHQCKKIRVVIFKIKGRKKQEKRTANESVVKLFTSLYSFFDLSCDASTKNEIEKTNFYCPIWAGQEKFIQRNQFLKHQVKRSFPIPYPYFIFCWECNEMGGLQNKRTGKYKNSSCA